MKFHLETKVASCERHDGNYAVTLEGAGGSTALECDRILVAAGRKPNSDGLGLEEAGVTIGADGKIPVDADFLTSVPGIYAIGDLVAGPMLAHKASEEGIVCIERMRGEKSVVDYQFIPGVVYTWPEAAGVGMTEEQLKAEGVLYDVGRFSFMASGRARCMDETEGFVKMLAHRQTGRVLGIHIIGPRASDLIAEGVTAMTYGATAEDIALTFHAHPTLAETIKEAALDVLKRAIHS